MRSSSVWRFENIRRAAAASRCISSKLEVCLNISKVSVHINRVVSDHYYFVLKSLPSVVWILNGNSVRAFGLT